eukprot:gene13209-19044_t
MGTRGMARMAMKPPTKPKARTTPAAGVSAVSAVQNPVLSTAAPTEPAQITPPRATGSASSRSLPTWVLPSVRSTVHVVPPTPAPTKKRQAEQRAPGPGLQSPPSKKQQTEPRVSDLLQQADKDLQQIQLCTSQIARLRKDIGVLHSAAEETARDSDEIIRGLSREIYDLRGALQFAHLQEARSQGASQALKLQPQRARGPDPKPATPPFYHGAHKGSEAETWLFQLENYFRLLAQRYPEQLADDYKISYAVSLLRDTAAQWWILRTKTNSGEQAIHSFEGFKAALSKKFVPVNAKEQAREKLAYLTQTRDLQVYVEQFENLSLQIDDLSAAEGMDKFCRGLKPEHQIWVKTYGVSTLEEAVNLAHKVSAFSSALQTMTPPPYRAPIDAMDIDVMHMNALTGRSPKDKRELYHEHVQELVSFPPVHDRPLTPGPQRPQRDYQSPSRQGNHPSPGRQGNYPSYGVEMLSALQMRKCVRRNDALLAIVNPVAATEELHAMGYEPVPGKLDPIKSHLTPANHEKLEVLVHERTRVPSPNYLTDQQWVQPASPHPRPRSPSQPYMPGTQISQMDLDLTYGRGTYQNFHKPWNRHNRFLADAQPSARNAYRPIERMAPPPFDTSGRYPPVGSYDQRPSSAPPFRPGSPTIQFDSSQYDKMTAEGHTLLDNMTTQTGAPCFTVPAIMEADLEQGKPLMYGDEGTEEWKVARVQAYV